MHNKVFYKKAKKEPSCGSLSLSRRSHNPRIHSVILLSLRFFITLFLVFGVCYTVNDAFYLGQDNAYFFFIAFVCNFVFYLIFTSLRWCIVGLIISFAAIFAVSYIGCGCGPADFIVGGVFRFWNELMLSVTQMGYITPNTMNYGTQSILGLFVVLGVFASFVFTVFTRKKTFPAGIIFVGLIFVIPFYFYGLLDEITSIIPLLCGTVGACVMKNGEKRSLERSESSVSGFFVMLISLIMLMSLTFCVSSPFVEVTPIKDVCDFASGVIDDIMNNRPVDLGWGSGIDSPDHNRNARASLRVHYGKKILNVYSERKTPLYLRTWAGGAFDGDSWKPVKYEQYCEDFSIKEVKVDPSELTLEMIGRYSSTGMSSVINSLGFRLNDINIELYSPTQTKVLPTPHLATEMPMRLFADELYEVVGELSEYDGVITKTDNNVNIYKVNTLTKAYFGEANNQKMRDMIIGYSQFMSYSKNMDINEYAEMLVEEYPIGVMSSPRYYYRKYSEFIKKVYGEYETNEAIERAVQEIFDSTDIEKYFIKVSGGPNAVKRTESGNNVFYKLSENGKVCIDDIAVIVSDYLDEKCDYDLFPKHNDSLEIMDDFLFNSQEGYCVQFATAGTLILRKLGFCARYAEGYVASDFTSNPYDKKLGQFMSVVYDNCAHAWTEVWVDGIGWRQLEMTPAYTDLMNVVIDNSKESSESFVSSAASSAETTIPTESESSTEEETYILIGDPPINHGDDDEVFGDIKIILAIITVSIIACVLVAVCVVLYKASIHRTKNKLLMEKARSYETLGAEERSMLESAITCRIGELLNAYGCEIKDGELPMDFGNRLQIELADIDISFSPKELINVISKQVYGGVITKEEFDICVKAIECLLNSARVNLGSFKYVKLWLKGIL